MGQGRQLGQMLILKERQTNVAFKNRCGKGLDQQLWLLLLSLASDVPMASCGSRSLSLDRKSSPSKMLTVSP